MRIKQADVCDAPGRCSVPKVHGVGWVFLGHPGLVTHSSLMLSEFCCGNKGLRSRQAQLISRRQTLTRSRGDFLPRSRCPGILTGAQVRSWLAVGARITPLVPCVLSSGPLCPSFRIRHPLAAKANWWPGQAAPVSAACLSCYRGNCMSPGAALLRRSCFSFPLTFVFPLGRGEEPPKPRERSMGQGGAHWLAYPHWPTSTSSLRWGDSSPTAGCLGTHLPLPRGDKGSYFVGR